MKTINEETYVDQAESVIMKLSSRINQRTGRSIPMVTTSKIRNLLAMCADIYNEITNSTEETLSQAIKERIEYLRIRFVYEAGRDAAVKDFVMESKILDILKEINGSRKNYLLFNHYMEALVAFHKFHGGKD